MTSPAPFIDHTLLKAVATTADIRRLCEEAVECGFVAVCIPPIYVPTAAECLYGSGVSIATVVGFPLGYQSTRQKACEAAAAVAAGAGEIDMVIHLGAVFEGSFDAVTEEIRQVVAAARGAEVKVIIECCYLQDEQKRALVECAVTAGAAFVKTSTGFGSGGATLADVQLLVAAAAGRIRVKAAGGIRNWSDCQPLLAAGAARIGTSAGVAIVAGWQASERGHL